MDPEPGEEVFFHGHPSWLSLLAFFIKGFLVAVGAGVIAGLVTAAAAGHVQVGWVIVAVLVSFAVLLLVGFLIRLRTTYSITNVRLTIDQGLIARDVHETRLERVQNVNSSQSLLERILRIGTVDFDTAGGAEYDFAFRGVANPHKVVRTVDRALQQLTRGGTGL